MSRTPKKVEALSSPPETIFQGKLPAKVTISRVSCSDRDDYIAIRVEDVASGICVVEVEMGSVDFTNAVFGLAYRSAIAAWNGLVYLGSRRETKHENVPCPDLFYEKPGPEREAAARKVLAPYEKDGWEGDSDDLFNHHHRVSKNVQRVGFLRWVRP